MIYGTQSHKFNRPNDRISASRIWKRFCFGKRDHLGATNKQKLLPMVTYQKILEKSQAANSLIGMSLAEFEELYAEFERAHTGRVSALQYTQRHKRKRRRAVGAGRKHKYALRDRLLMTLFWLRAYTTYTVLGTLYDLDKTTVEDYLNHVMLTLSEIGSFHFERPAADVPKIRSLQEVMKAFPDVLTMCEFDQPQGKCL